ncbi:hypothetical protein BDU57DRAFT_213650 [Ampelomyces quisqualis]|uniref:Uncharacterized protein n=1 Tax=Ampelomyces quisqualis TaxID=50730 RepID=A0A6A5QMN3_AMPQU|nr:hypothetical protein BDU57DRAFT_213650 [Ampelomyces quisqualis]
MSNNLLEPRAYKSCLQPGCSCLPRRDDVTCHWARRTPGSNCCYTTPFRTLCCLP